MSSLCSVCNSYPCPGCTSRYIDDVIRLKAELAAKDREVAILRGFVDPAVAFAAGRADAVRRICAWMRAARTPHAQAEAIERGDWEDTVVGQDTQPLRPSK